MVTSSLDPNQVLGHGLTRYQHQRVARELGYQGEFGQGQHNRFLDSTPGARESFNQNILREVQRQDRISNTRQGFADSKDQISALQIGKTALSVGKGLSSTGGFISNSIDSVASSAFPTTFKAPANFVGPPVANAGSLSLSGALGGAGAGYAIGSILGSFTGLKQDGASIGGAVGGAAAGTGLLSGIGIAGGPLGIAVGALAGSVLGGFFGSEPKANMSSFFGILGEGGEFNEFRTASKSIGEEQGEAVGQSFGQFSSAFAAATGANFDNAHVFGGYNDKYNGGYYIRTATFEGDGVLGEAGQDQNLERRFNVSDEASVIEAFADVTDRLLRDSGKNQTLVDQIDSLKAEGLSTTQAIDSLFTTGLAGSLEAPEGPQADIISEVPTTPKERITRKVQVAQAQYDDFVKAVKKKRAGRASTIVTGPRGLLEEPEEIFRPQLAAVA